MEREEAVLKAARKARRPWKVDESEVKEDPRPPSPIPLWKKK
jgi:hypothetical protein